MYTTMDCDFFEQSYYYPQPSPQGERVSDDLSWLICPVVINPEPKEQVNEITNVVPEDIVTPLQSTPVLPIEHPKPEEVNSDVPQVIDNSSENVVEVDILNRYKLPPTSTKGIPPKRYDLEFVAQRSRYPVRKESNENLSHSAMAFNTALYSNDVPKIVE